MKNVLFAFAFLLVASFAFAANNVEAPIKNSPLMADNAKECKINIKGTYGGKEVDVDVTIEADDCFDAAVTILTTLQE